MKTCTICKIEKPYEEFANHPKTLDRRGSQCKKCDASEKRKRHRERKQKLVDLAGGGCQRCGYNKCVDALDFHHNQGKKEFIISRYFGWEKMQKEAAKCIVICANCHREEHHFKG